MVFFRYDCFQISGARSTNSRISSTGFTYSTYDFLGADKCASYWHGRVLFGALSLPISSIKVVCASGLVRLKMECASRLVRLNFKQK